jgi:hypothetical protein
MSRVLIILLLIVTLGFGGWYFLSSSNFLKLNQNFPEETEDLGFFIQNQVLYNENENLETTVPNPTIIKAQYRYFKLNKISEGKYKDYQTYLVETTEAVLGGGGPPSGKIYYLIAEKDGKMVFYYDKNLDDNNYFKESYSNRIVMDKLENFDTFPVNLNFPDIISEGGLLELARISDFYTTQESSIYGLLQDYQNREGFKKIKNIDGKDIYTYYHPDYKTTYFLVNFDGVLVNYSSSLKGIEDATYLNVNAEASIAANNLKLEPNDTAHSSYRLVVTPCTMNSNPLDVQEEFGIKVDNNNNLTRIASASDIEIYKINSLNTKEFESLVTHVLNTTYYNKDNPEKNKGEMVDLENGGLLIYKDIFGKYRALANQYFVGGGCGKPVIYLYPEKDTEISVRLINPTYFTAVIPNYNSYWKVLAQPNGILKDLKTELTKCESLEIKFGTEYATKACEKNQYPFLYWSGKTKGINYPKAENGFIVKKENLNPFFDEKLSFIGFNQKEINDFKEYWVAKLSKNNSDYFRITFFQNDVLNSMFPMEVKPNPNSSIRIFMDWSAINENTSIIEQKLKSYSRNGFTLVEWGGLDN